MKWEGKPLTISNSELQVFKSCRRKWWLTYYRELGLRHDKKNAYGPAQLGTRIHFALEMMYRADENPIEVINESYAEDIQYLEENGGSDDAIMKLRKEQDLARAMIEGYIDWVRDEAIDEGMTYIESEAVVQVDSAVPGVKLRGKLDQVWERKSDGARLFRDFKTVPNFSGPKDMLEMDEQMKFYHLLEYLYSIQETGKEPVWRTDGALYTMLRKVKRTAAAKPPFYEQISASHNMAELKTMYVRVTVVVEEIVAARLKMAEMEKMEDLPVDAHHYVFPPRPSRDCSWSCDFVAVCPMFDDGSNAEGFIKEYYERIDPHERYTKKEEE